MTIKPTVKIIQIWKTFHCECLSLNFTLVKIINKGGKVQEQVSLLIQIQKLIQQSQRYMERLCGIVPCFHANESNIEIEIPLIYQNPQEFYFPYELENSNKIRNSKKVKKYDFVNENKSFVSDQNLKRVKSQVNSNLWTSQHISISNNATTISRKQDYYPIDIKQNINPRINTVFPSQKQINIYFDNQLYRSKSSQNQITTTLKANQSQHNFKQLFPTKKSFEQKGHFDIVPVSEYHSLIQKNHQMKRIIQQEYRPLKNCYQSLREQQKDRQKLVTLLQYKVKQLGQKLKQRSINTMNYIVY